MTNKDQRSFRALVGAQFLGAFNDNLFKQLILFLAAGLLFPGQDMQGLAFAVFALPFVVFSGIAGDLSERFSKRSIIVRMKVAEILIMVFGAIALHLLNWYFMLAVLFIMGLQSAFFGPSKYGVIPELVPSEQLLKANGTIAMTTFLAILLGQALAGPLLDIFGNALWIPGMCCIAFALLGTLSAQRMAPLTPKKPDLPLSYNPFGNLWQTIAVLRRQKGLFRIVILNSLFWFNGGVIQQAIVGMGEAGYLAIAEGEKKLLSYILVTLALSIIIGSTISPQLENRIPAGRMAIAGAIVMVFCQITLISVGWIVHREQGGLILTHLLMACLGFSGAFFVVPIQSYLQHAPEEGMKGQTFAVNNFMNFIFIFLGGIYYLSVREGMGMGPTLVQAVPGIILLVYLWFNRRNVAQMRIGYSPRSTSKPSASQ